MWSLKVVVSSSQCHKLVCSRLFFAIAKTCNLYLLYTEDVDFFSHVLYWIKIPCHKYKRYENNRERNVVMMYHLKLTVMFLIGCNRRRIPL